MTDTFRTGAPVSTATVGPAVIDILAAQALRAPESITPAHKVADLGIDSLGMAEVIFAIEERFDVAVPFDGVETDARGMDLTTVAGVIAAVQALLVRAETVA
jgi:acyl carrier protein